jgi:hypothetical protein
MHRIKDVVRHGPKLAPVIGAAVGGIAGSVLGADFGLAGGAAGGVAGYLIEKIANRVGDADADPPKSDPRVFGGILTDTTDFVGRRTELRDVHDFISKERTGVCLLYGFGGCGKSALLKVVINRMRLLEAARKERKKAAVFLWSFAQDPSLERFFAEFSAYVNPLLTKSDRATDGPSRRTYLNLPQQIDRSGHDIILILDGIETVTVDDDRVEARDGSLAVPALRVLLQRTAESGCGNLMIICTSRVVPPELKRSDVKTLMSRDLSLLPVEDGVSLLKRKGVRGRRLDMESVVRDLRKHAYSVSLMGDLLRQAYRGDVRQSSQILTGANSLETPLHKILDWYQAILQPEALAYLRTASIFRSAASRNEISSLMQFVLSHTTSKGTVRRTDDRLVTATLKGYGLLFEDLDHTSGYEVTALHPIIREYFYEQIANPQSFHREAYRIVEARLPEKSDVANQREFTMLQELVFQALGAKDPKLAWKVYYDRIGGYAKVGYEIADHPSGTKIVDMFLAHADSVVNELPSEAVFDLHVDGALYLKNEGRLDDAVEVLTRLDGILSRLQFTDDRPVSYLLVQAGIELLRGEIGASEESIRRARRMLGTLTVPFDPTTRARIDKEFLTRGAVLKVVRGEDGISDFEASAAIDLAEGVVPHDFGPIRHVWSLTQHGRFAEAEQIATASLAPLERIDANMLIQRLSCMAAINASWAGDLDTANRWSERVTPWALKADIHVAVLSWLQRGIQAYRSGDLNNAEILLAEGSGFAGDGGFLLEWLDMTALRAHIMLLRGNTKQGSELSERVIKGSDSAYLVHLKGASNPGVNYVWPLATALALQQQIQRGSVDVGTIKSRSPGLATVSGSENPLFGAAVGARIA